jgi:transcriptional regulator with XRE-family HTH domain
MVRKSYPTLREFLKRTGTTQEVFAARVGITQSQLSKFMNGRQPIRLDLALKIAALADIPVSSLIAHSEERAS